MPRRDWRSDLYTTAFACKNPSGFGVCSRIAQRVQRLFNRLLTEAHSSRGSGG